MKRSYLLRRPQDEDDDYYGGGADLVHAKPIDDRHAKKLGDAYKAKDFVKGSEKSQQQFYGMQTIVSDESTPIVPAESSRPLTHDERNKLSAKIIKAEMKQNKELARKLREKLESGVTSGADHTSSNASESDQSVLLMKVDKKSGLVVPAISKKASSSAQSTSKGTVDQEYDRQMGLKEMVANEKSTTAIDQLTMFGRAAKMCSDNKVDDDWVVDDNILSHPKKRRHEEKDRQRNRSRQVQGCSQKVT